MKKFKELYTASHLATFDEVDFTERTSCANRNVSRQDGIIEAIKSTLRVDAGQHTLSRIQSASVHRAFAMKRALNESTREDNECYKILETLQTIGAFNTKSGILSFDYTPAWVKAISLCRLYDKEFNRRNEYKEELAHPKEKERANSIKYLNQYGLSYHWNNDELVIDNEDKIVTMLANWTKELGGEKLLADLLKRGKYSTETGRYYFPQQSWSNNIGFTADIPFNYLINLAASNIRQGVSHPRHHSEEIIQVATAFCLAAYSVQQESIWSNIMHATEDDIRYISRQAQNKSLYQCTQTSRYFTQDFCDYIVEKLQGSYQLPDDITWEDFQKAFHFFVKNSTPNHFVRIKHSQAEKAIGIGFYKLLPYISTENPNRDYASPFDFEHSDYGEYPLVRLPHNHLLIYPSSFNSWAWYDALMNMLRKQQVLGTSAPKERIDLVMGGIIENYVISRLDTKGIPHATGNYTIKKGEYGEADICVEAADSILLFEIKKKLMIRKSHEGYPEHIIADLTDSVFASQYQCLRTEYQLRHNGFVDLTDKTTSTTYRLKHNNRRVIRISLTLGDFGGLQTRGIMDELLKMMLGDNFVLSIPLEQQLAMGDDYTRLAAKFTALSAKQKKLRTLVAEMKKESMLPDNGNTFIHSLFLNVEQLVAIIGMSEDKEQFAKNIAEYCYVSMGTKDNWTEGFLGRRFLEHI